MSNREIQHKNIDKEISDITSQLKDLKIVFEKNCSKLITKQRLLLLKKKDKEKSNPFKVGQRVRIMGMTVVTIRVVMINLLIVDSK